MLIKRNGSHLTFNVGVEGPQELDPERDRIHLQILLGVNELLENILKQRKKKGSPSGLESTSVRSSVRFPAKSEASSFSEVNSGLTIPTNKTGDLLEARTGIEPVHKGFADLSFTAKPQKDTKLRPVSRPVESLTLEELLIEYAGHAGYVYILQAEGLNRVKIGMSATVPNERIRQLQCSSPVKLKVLAIFRGGEKLEKELHKRFDGKRLKGEWFEVDEQLAKFLELAARISKDQDV